MERQQSCKSDLRQHPRMPRSALTTRLGDSGQTGYALCGVRRPWRPEPSPSTPTHLHVCISPAFHLPILSEGELSSLSWIRLALEQILMEAHKAAFVSLLPQRCQAARTKLPHGGYQDGGHSNVVDEG
jgi:hypothetical protein